MLKPLAEAKSLSLIATVGPDVPIIQTDPVKLQEALKQLPEKQRMAIVMFTIEQMPQKQVAETLNCSVEAVKWHVFQGRKRLKEMLKEYL